MTDYRSLEHLLVYRDGEHVAHLRRLPKGCEFRYTDEFLRSSRPRIALHLSKKEPIQVEGLANLPTYFAGLLPEGVMFEAVKNLIGSAADDLFAILAATGADAIGDIEVRAPGEDPRKPSLNLEQAAHLIHSLLENQNDFPSRNLAAIPGVQPKLSIGEIVRSGRKTTYIAKFDTARFPHLIENEFTFMRLAKRCGLHTAKVDLKPQALIVHRFDREPDPQSSTLRKIHIEDMLQVMDLFPNSKYVPEYRDLLEAMRRLGVSKATILEALRLYLFSYLIGNGDLHAKNVSLLRHSEEEEWRLTPAYDLLSTLPYQNTLLGADQMALALTDEAAGRFTPEDFVSLAADFGIPPRATTNMIQRTAQAVKKHLPTSSDALGPQTLQTVEDRTESML